MRSRKNQFGKTAQSSEKTPVKEMGRKEKIVDSLGLPKDTLLGASIVTITGNRDLWIENYRGILEYTTERITLQGKNCRISVEGCRLSIDYYTNEDMRITGCIEKVSYL